MVRSNRCTWCGYMVLGVMLGACQSSSLALYKSSADDNHPLRHGDDRAIATLSMQDDSAHSPQQLHLYKIHKGYALRNYIDQTPNRTSAIALSHDHEHQWFTGLNVSWSF